jgi:small subunit ribosomal protein S24e
MAMVIHFTKIKVNKLLSRCQMILDVFHPPDLKVTKEQIKEKVKEKFKKPHISIFGMKKLYGGGRTKCFCLVYDSDDAMKKFEPVSRLRRAETEKIPPKERKPKGKKEGRKVLKVKKHQGQKKRGTKRRQELNLQRKQNKKKN